MYIPGTNAPCLAVGKAPVAQGGGGCVPWMKKVERGGFWEYKYIACVQVRAATFTTLVKKPGWYFIPNK